MIGALIENKNLTWTQNLIISETNSLGKTVSYVLVIVWKTWLILQVISTIPTLFRQALQGRKALYFRWTEVDMNYTRSMKEFVDTATLNLSDEIQMKALF